MRLHSHRTSRCIAFTAGNSVRRLFVFLLLFSLASYSSGTELEQWELDGLASNTNQALYLAAQAGNTGKVQELIAGGAKVNYVHHKQSPRTALGVAISSGRLEMVEMLVNYGAQIRTNVSHDPTPLTAAAAAGHAEIVSFLLERKVDPNVGSLTDGLPLLAAAANGHAEIARLLIEAGADANGSARFDGSPLINAARRGDATLVKLLLGHGADVNQRVRGDDTALIAAVMNQHVETVAILMAAGADASQSGDFELSAFRKRTPLNQAESRGNQAIIKLLTQK